MARGQITILPLAEHQYLDQNGSKFHLQKMGVGGGANNYGHRRLEIDPQRLQGYAWTVESVDRVGGNIPALM